MLDYQGCDGAVLSSFQQCRKHFALPAVALACCLVATGWLLLLLQSARALCLLHASESTASVKELSLHGRYALHTACCNAVETLVIGVADSVDSMLLPAGHTALRSELRTANVPEAFVPTNQIGRCSRLDPPRKDLSTASSAYTNLRWGPRIAILNAARPL